MNYAPSSCSLLLFPFLEVNVLDHSSLSLSLKGIEETPILFFLPPGDASSPTNHGQLISAFVGTLKRKTLFFDLSHSH